MSKVDRLGNRDFLRGTTFDGKNKSPLRVQGSFGKLHVALNHRVEVEYRTRSQASVKERAFDSVRKDHRDK